MINSLDAEKNSSQARTVEWACPANVPNGVVLLRPLALEQSFGLSITSLLFPIIDERVATVMPHHRRRTKTNFPSSLQNPPAEINVVSSGAKRGIKST